MTTQTLGGWLVHVMVQADGALSLEEALHVIMDSMKEYFPCQSVAVILIDPETKELRIKTSRQISYTFAKQFHRNGPSVVAERVVLEQRPMLLNHLDPESPTYRDLKLEHDFRSAVLAPVVNNQRGIGYIFCDRAEQGEFTEPDLLHLQVVGYLVGSLIEKFELIKSAKKLSQIDDATRTLQYKAFVPAFATELERAQKHGYSVAAAMLLVDVFRKYVETWGIRQAHALLAEVASAVRKHAKSVDILARFSADEFILCLSGVTRDEAMQRLEAIRGEVAETVVGQGGVPVRVVAGAVMLASRADLKRRPQDILATLGRALVAAKERGEEGIRIGAMEPA